MLGAVAEAPAVLLGPGEQAVNNVGDVRAELFGRQHDDDHLEEAQDGLDDLAVRSLQKQHDGSDQARHRLGVELACSPSLRRERRSEG